MCRCHLLTSSVQNDQQAPSEETLWKWVRTNFIVEWHQRGEEIDNVKLDTTVDSLKQDFR